MDALSYTAVRANLARVLDRVCDEHEPLLITRQKAETTVLLSLSHYESLRETVHLLSTKKNATRLQDAINEIESGLAQARDLVEP